MSLKYILQEEAEFLCTQLDKNYRYWIEYYNDVEISGGAFAIPHRIVKLGDHIIKVFSRTDGSLLYEVMRCEVGFIPIYPEKLNDCSPSNIVCDVNHGTNTI